MSAWIIHGREVLDEVSSAPPHVQRIIGQFLEVLRTGPYPGNPLLHSTPARGFEEGTFIAAYDSVMLMYAARELPPVRVVFLLEVIWSE